jgi:hypothetical protein
MSYARCYCALDISSLLPRDTLQRYNNRSPNITIVLLFSQSHSRDQNVAGVPVVPVGAVPGGAHVVFRRRYLSVVNEVVRVQSQRSRQRPRLRLQQQLLQGECVIILGAVTYAG